MPRARISLRCSMLIAVLLWAHLLTLPKTALGSLVFVNPVQKITGEAIDFETNSIHPVGSSMTVEWTSDDVPKDPLSLLLFQHGSPPGDAEHIFRNITFPNKKGRWPWTVVTNQTLDRSHVFSFSLFFEGKQNPEAISHEFNLTVSNGTAQPPPPSTTAKRTSAGLDTPASSTAPPTAAVASATATATPSGSDGMSEGQKIGLGVGLGVGMPLAALLAFCCFFLWRLSKRGKNKDDQAVTYHVPETKKSREDDGKSHQQEKWSQQPQHHAWELPTPAPLYEAETPPDDSAVQRQRRGPAELGGYEGVELQP